MNLFTRRGGECKRVGILPINFLFSPGFVYTVLITRARFLMPDWHAKCKFIKIILLGSNARAKELIQSEDFALILNEADAKT